MKKELKNKIEEKLHLRPVSHIKNSNKLVNNKKYLSDNLITENGFKSGDSTINNLMTNPAEICLFRGKIEDYKFVKEIGKGAYAVVKSAIHKSSGNKYAIKVYEKYKLMDPAKKSAVKREIQILKQIDHKNIVKMYEVIDAPKQVILYYQKNLNKILKFSIIKI